MTLTLDEMIAEFLRLSAHAGSALFQDEPAAIRAHLEEPHLPPARRRLFQAWIRHPVLVAQIYATQWDYDKMRRYAEWRREGSPFPPVIIVSLPPHWSGRRWIAVEGNHRVLAAREVGDKWIDAFVPVGR